MNYKKLFYFDIETTTEFRNVEYLKENNIVKYNNFIERKRRFGEESTYPSTYYIENAPLLPEYGKIIVFSFGFFKGGKFVVSSITNDNEKELLLGIKKVFDHISEINAQICGQSIKDFDIAWIVRKLMQYNLKIPTILQTIGKKPWEVGYVDTKDLWKGISSRSASLSEIAVMLGLESPKNDISGKDVYSVYWDDNDLDRIVKYCERDVKVLPDIVKKIFTLNGIK